MVTPLPDLWSNRTRPGSVSSTVAMDQDCRPASKKMRGLPQLEPLLDNVLCMHLCHRKGGANLNSCCGSVIYWGFGSAYRPARASGRLRFLPAARILS